MRLMRLPMQESPKPQKPQTRHLPLSPCYIQGQADYLTSVRDTPFPNGIPPPAFQNRR
ncbi:hypothetical protein Barb4_03259 [Bacteroidales bacterium Barb4]|nr:hypothetical protein Barb4_03259 [Bacteroidales bacterium Barb4]